MAIEREKEFKFSDKDFRFIVSLVSQHTGIVLADQKRDMVYGRLARRLRELKFNEFSQYCDLLNSDRGDTELSNFVNAITTNLTSFFREDHHFKHLGEELEKIAMSHISNKKIRIWSAACSSGPEPYSIAMTLSESVKNIAAWDARILATDIDTNMLAKAQAGIYRKSDLEKIPSYLRIKYVDRMKKDADEGTISEGVKKLITFKQLNLLQEWPMKGPFDMIFCRNVVIYFDKPTQVKLFDKMADLMKPDGILYIGHSENLYNVCDRFKLIGRTIYKKIK